MTVYTIGHSNHGLEKFIALLQVNQIDVVVDIRSKPYSRFALQFNKTAISNSLKNQGIRYLYLGDKLGGRPNDKKLYDDDGHVSYLKISQTSEFWEGIDRVIKEGQGYRLVLMCSEEDPLKCHRYHLVSSALKERGVIVAHIRGDGRQQYEDELTNENVANTKREKQLNLFS